MSESDHEITVVELPDGKPEVGDTVRLEYVSKRSGNVLERTGEVVSAEMTDNGRLNFKVKEPDEPGLLWAYVFLKNEWDMTGSVSRVTERSKPHFETHYGDLVTVAKVSENDSRSEP